MVAKRTVEDFADEAEKPLAARDSRDLPIRNAIKDEPVWKTRNREPKHKGTQFRFSESQLKLLQMAKADQEKSIQKILEAIVWPVLEEQYGEGSITEGQAPS